MKNILVLLIPALLVGCSTTELVQNQNGKLLYTFDSTDLKSTVQHATKECGKAGKSAELIGQPNCGGIRCFQGMCLSDCSATFICK